MTGHLEKLKNILPDSERSRIPPCIEELVVERPFLKPPDDQERYPPRQDITQFLAAWLKHIGVAREDGIEWLVEFCTDVFSATSSSSRSQIRHSTKSNQKYIYRYDIPFEYEVDEAQGTERGEIRYPSSVAMFISAIRGKARTVPPEDPSRKRKREQEAKPLQVKEKYKEQFGKALEYMEEKVGQGISKKDLVVLLNNQGFKTRTGRPWTYPILLTEIKARGT